MTTDRSERSLSKFGTVLISSSLTPRRASAFGKSGQSSKFTHSRRATLEDDRTKRDNRPHDATEK
jgi:hypothetical protein